MGWNSAWNFQQQEEGGDTASERPSSATRRSGRALSDQELPPSEARRRRPDAPRPMTSGQALRDSGGLDATGGGGGGKKPTRPQTSYSGDQATVEEASARVREWAACAAKKVPPAGFTAWGEQPGTSAATTESVRSRPSGKASGSTRPEHSKERMGRNSAWHYEEGSSLSAPPPVATEATAEETIQEHEARRRRAEMRERSVHERLQRALTQQKRQRSLQSAYGGAPPKPASSPKPKKTGKASSSRSGRSLAPDSFRSAADELAARKLRMRLEQGRQSATLDANGSFSSTSKIATTEPAVPLAGPPTGALQVAARANSIASLPGAAARCPSGRAAGSAASGGGEDIDLEANEELLDALLDELS